MRNIKGRLVPKIHLTLGDADLTNGVIQILQTKFGKSRLVFIHPTTATMVARYLQARQERMGRHGCVCLSGRVRQQPTQPSVVTSGSCSLTGADGQHRLYKGQVTRRRISAREK